jgi:succinate dehydrogenase / fumarate reductase cytochrome b subunit
VADEPAMSEVARKAVERPLSPHLSIYRPVLTMVMSILHRIAGIALYFGTLLLVWWLVAAAWSAEAFATVQGFMGSPLGHLILVGYTWTLMHHLLGGIRHFLWDFGIAMGVREREWVARGTIIGSVVLTVLIWTVVLAMR